MIQFGDIFRSIKCNSLFSESESQRATVSFDFTERFGKYGFLNKHASIWKGSSEKVRLSWKGNEMTGN